MIKVDGSLCTRCGSCVRVCPFTVLLMQETGPAAAQGKEPACLRCMHCVAICPVSALSFDGIPAEAEPAAPVSPNAYEQLTGLIAGHRSIRRFANRPVPQAEIRAILDTVRYAPSAKNAHPNSWILVHETSKAREILTLVHRHVEETGVSKEVLSEYAAGNDIVTLQAPHLLFGVAPTQGINPYTDTVIALSDADLLFHAKGIGACWAGYLARLTNASPAIREYIGLDESMQVYGALAFGYPQGEHYSRLPYRKPLSLRIL